MTRSLWISSTSLLVFLGFPLMYTTLEQNCKQKTFSDKTIIQLGDYTNSVGINTSISGCITPATLRAIQEELIVVVTCTDHNIPNILEEAVSNLSTLYTLTLQRNRINTIKRGAFHNLSLVNVQLGENEIEFLDDEIFINVPNLRVLEMNKNNLQLFDSHWIGHQPELYDLDLSQNSIHALSRGSFNDLTGLLRLNISHNQIRHVNEKVFHGLLNLTHLDLSYNRINHLYDNLIIPDHPIVFLNLYSNNLSYISDASLESMKNIRTVSFLYNPWLCACYDKISEWAQRYRISLNKWQFPYVICDGEKNPEDIAVCVLTNETRCVKDYKEDLLSVLVSEESDYSCYFEYEWKPSTGLLWLFH